MYPEPEEYRSKIYIYRNPVPRNPDLYTFGYCFTLLCCKKNSK